MDNVYMCIYIFSLFSCSLFHILYTWGQQSSLHIWSWHAYSNTRPLLFCQASPSTLWLNLSTASSSWQVSKWGTLDSLLWMVKDCLNQKLRCVYTKLNAFGGQVPFLGILACSRLGLQIRQTHKVVWVHWFVVFVKLTRAKLLDYWRLGGRAPRSMSLGRRLGQ